MNTALLVIACATMMAIAVITVARGGPSWVVYIDSGLYALNAQRLPGLPPAPKLAEAVGTAHSTTARVCQALLYVTEGITVGEASRDDAEAIGDALQVLLQNRPAEYLKLRKLSADLKQHVAAEHALDDPSLLQRDWGSVFDAMIRQHTLRDEIDALARKLAGALADELIVNESASSAETGAAHRLLAAVKPSLDRFLLLCWRDYGAQDTTPEAGGVFPAGIVYDVFVDGSFTARGWGDKTASKALRAAQKAFPKAVKTPPGTQVTWNVDEDTVTVRLHLPAVQTWHATWTGGGAATISGTSAEKAVIDHFHLSSRPSMWGPSGLMFILRGGEHDTVLDPETKGHRGTLVKLAPD